MSVPPPKLGKVERENKITNINLVTNSNHTRLNLDTGSTRTTVNPSFVPQLTNVTTNNRTSRTATGELLKSKLKGTLDLNCQNENGEKALIPIGAVDVMNVTEPLVSGKDVIKHGKIVLANQQHGGCYIETYDGKGKVPVLETSTGFYISHENTDAHVYLHGRVVKPTNKVIEAEQTRQAEMGNKVARKLVKKREPRARSSEEEKANEKLEREMMGRNDTLPRVLEKTLKKAAREIRKQKAIRRQEESKEALEEIEREMLLDEASRQADALQKENIPVGEVGEDPLPEEVELLETQTKKWDLEYEGMGYQKKLEKDVSIAEAYLAKTWAYFHTLHCRWNHISYRSLSLLLWQLGDRTPYIRLFCVRKVIEKRNTYTWFRSCQDCQSSSAVHPTAKGTDSGETAQGPRDLTYIDFIPVIKPKSIFGSSAKLLIKDKYSKLVKSYALEAPTTTEAIKALRKYMVKMGGVAMFKGKKIRSDNDKCFSPDNVEWTRFCDLMEWDSKNSPSYRHDFNGEVESFAKSHAIKERTMLKASGMPLEMWCFSSTAQCEVSNCSPVTATHSRYSTDISKYHSPYQRFWGKSIDLDHIKVFGCSAMVPLRVLNKDADVSSKFKDRKVKCCYLGPSEHSSYGTGVFGYIKEGDSLKNLRYKEAHYTDVDWIENEYYFKDKGYASGNNLPTEADDEETAVYRLREEETRYDELVKELTSEEDWRPENADLTESLIKATLMMLEDTEGESPGVQDMSYEKYKGTSPGEVKDKWGKQFTKEWGGFRDRVLYQEVDANSLPGNVVVHKIKTICEIKKNGDYKVRSVVAWMEKLARSVYKTRLPDPFSPASKMENPRMLMAIESYLRKSQKLEGNIPPGEEMVRMAIDIKQAYLNGEFDKDSTMQYYVTPPDGFYEHMDGKPKLGVVWLLLRPLYGLPISGKLWYLKFRGLITKFGFTKLDKEACVFFKRKTDGEGPGDLLGAMTIHVDDSYMIGQRHWLDKFVEDIKSEVTITELGDTEKHLGMEITVDGDGDVSLSQYQMTMNLLEEHGLVRKDSQGNYIKVGHPKYLPMPATTKIVKSDIGDPGVVLDELVGSLLWIMRTCNPALAVYTSLLGSQVKHPKRSDYDLAKRVLSWMLGFPRAGLRFKADLSRPPLEVFVDAELGGQDQEGKKLRSRGGFVIYMWGQVVHYRSRRHTITSTSTFDSEIRAIMEALEKAIVMKQNLVELGLMGEKDPILVRSDSETAVKTLNNPLGSEKMGHLEFEDPRRYVGDEWEFDLQKYLVQYPEQTKKLQEKLLLSRVAELVGQKKIRLVHVPGVENISDFLTKCLGPEKFYWCTIRSMCLDVSQRVQHEKGLCDCVALPDFKNLRQKKQVGIGNALVDACSMRGMKNCSRATQSCNDEGD